jgi:hypothetical protein
MHIGYLDREFLIILFELHAFNEMNRYLSPMNFYLIQLRKIGRSYARKESVGESDSTQSLVDKGSIGLPAGYTRRSLFKNLTIVVHDYYIRLECK